jgi:non-ribosomal peptide synthetase-like protein
MYAHRLLIDALRIVIPSMIEIFGVISLFGLLYVAYSLLPLVPFILLSPGIVFIEAIILILCVVGVKNVLMGQFTPVIKPLWCPYVWLNEVVNGAYEAIAAPAISMFFGTPLIAWCLRLFGCKIGKHSFIETALFGEFDLVEIGDFAALNNNTIIQNHLFEDRIFKSSKLTIGNECSTGNMSVVLYDSEMRQGSSIGPLSLLMKSETLPPNTRWTGIPVEKTETAAPQGTIS